MPNLPPLPPPHVIADLYTEAVRFGDRLGPVGSVTVMAGRIEGSDGAYIGVDIFIMAAILDGVPGEHSHANGHDTVTTRRQFNGWSVLQTVFFRAPVPVRTVKAQIADAVAAEERVS